MIKVNEDLLALARLMPEPLYIVGGYVRDSLAGLEPHDIDLAGDIDPQTVIECLENTRFTVKPTSKKLMTLKIISDHAEYEYTAFRIDSYTEGHRPDTVKRTHDLREDALRRDFTVNAVYYEPLTEKIIDPLNGCEDLKKRLMKMTRKETFREDGLRLMRLVRQAAELNFEIDEDTLLSARENARLIAEIAPERIRDELDRILIADTRYGYAEAQYRGLKLLDKVGLLEIILPELTAGRGMPQRGDYHRYDVLEHMLQTVKFSAPEVRLAALLHDCGKPFCYINTGRYRGHDVEGERIAADIMNRLRYSNSVIKVTKTLIKLHMFDLKGDARENTVRLFIQRNAQILDRLIMLKQADYLGGGLLHDECPGCIRLKNTRDEMLSEQVPFSVSELAVGGRELAEMGIPEELRGQILYTLLARMSVKGVSLTKENQLKTISNILKEEHYGA